jgi:FtsP/CotA-like multicopper oxidase with cupredoxin domain
MFADNNGEVLSIRAPVDISMEGESEKLVPKPSTSRKTVSCWVYLLTTICFAVCLVGLGLGLGLGVPGIRGPPTDGAFGYGLSDDLVTTDSATLVNKTQLNLNTGFIVSSEATSREFDLNITQAWAAPDGVYKPMILANGQSPGPLIEANKGDVIRVRHPKRHHRHHCS